MTADALATLSFDEYLHLIAFVGEKLLLAGAATQSDFHWMVLSQAWIEALDEEEDDRLVAA